MATTPFIPVAQYLRMSTEHQQYSIQNQMIAIQEWAALHSMEVVKTYTDEARSGVRIENRDELKHLLADVTSGKATYKVILVYDVSRWGRFQDNDEATHYEFICKASGVPVLYCNEPFANDGTVPSLVIKALKRTMAAEYSRDLGERVRFAIQQMAKRGFKMGASPGYGLQRVSVPPTGKQTRILREGDLLEYINTSTG